MKSYNNGMEGVEFMYQESDGYQLDCRSKCRFYLRIFFDKTDVALISGHIVYQHLSGNFNLHNFKIVILNSLTEKFCSCQQVK